MDTKEVTTKESQSPHVQNMRQKFEAKASNIPASQRESHLCNNIHINPIYTTSNKVTNNTAKICNKNLKVNNNDELESRNAGNIQRLSQVVSEQPVSVVERTKLFQDSGGNSGFTPKKSLKTVSGKRLEDEAKDSPDKLSCTKDLGPLPKGPPPRKPPRSLVRSCDKKMYDEISSSSDNAADNSLTNVSSLEHKPVPVARKKSTQKVIVTGEAESVPRADVSKIQSTKGFMHRKLSNNKMKHSELTKYSVSKSVDSVLSTQCDINCDSDVKSQVQRQRSIQRPKMPPPRPPPPQLDLQRSKKIASELKSSHGLNKQDKSESRNYDHVPVCSNFQRSFKKSREQSRNLRRSLSEENIYAVPTKIFNNADSGKSTLKVNSLPKVEYAIPYEVINLKVNDQRHELHYMSSPVPGWDKKLPPTPKSQRKMKSAIKDLINQSFSVLKKTFMKGDGTDDGEGEGDSDSDVSVKDVQDRIIYVQSFRRKRESRPEVIIQPRLFEYLLVIGLEWIETAGTYHPTVISQFPEQQINFKHDKSLISCFCYPDAESWEPTSHYQSETYSFVLTDEKGTQTFAYCKRFLEHSEEATTPIVYCLVSTERDFSFYSKVLDEIEKRTHTNPENELNIFLFNLHEQNLPKPGEHLHFTNEEDANDDSMAILRSTDVRSDSVEFCHLLKCLDVENLLKAFSSILLERRVLFCASTLGILTQCVQAIAALLYPFSWQHTLVPVIPETMLDLCSMPTPYIMGVLSSCVHKVVTLPLEEVLIVDLDHSRIIKELGDENTILPRKIHSALSTALSLANNMTDPTASTLTLMMCEAFVEAFVHLVGHYENHISENENGVLEFERDAFIKAPYSRGIQMFLRWFTETQTFDVFINNRLAKGKRKSRYESGLFELRVEEYSDEMKQMSQTFRGNVRQVGKMVKDFGDKLKSMKAF